MASFFRHVLVLIWKNFLLKKRFWIGSLAEIILPPLFMAVMIGIRGLITPTDNPDTFFYNNVKFFNPGNTSSFGINILNTRCVRDGAFIGVAPRNAFTEKLVSFLESAPYMARNNTVKWFTSNDEMTKYVAGDQYRRDNPALCAGIVFSDLVTSDTAPASPLNYRYSLRFNASFARNRETINLRENIPDTNMDIDFVAQGYKLDYQDKYISSGFLALQYSVDSFIMSQHNFTNMKGFGVMAFPARAYKQDNFATISGSSLPLFLLISYLIPVSKFISGVVSEKEKKIKEGMKMMGLSDTAFYVSWYLTYVIIFLVISILISLVAVGGVWTKSELGVLFIFFFLFGLSTIAFCFFITVWFSKAKTAATVGVLAFFASFMAFFSVSDADINMGTKTWSSLLPTTNFGLGCSLIGNLEGGSIGARRDTLPITYQNYSLATCVGMFVVDFFLYTIVGWYLDHVLPSEFGTRQAPWFCFLPSFWCPRRARRHHQARNVAPSAGAVEMTHPSAAFGGPGCNADKFEPVSKQLQELEADSRCVEVKGLRKEFGTKVAVEGLDLTMYEGQIFALLGHNGAGKTTTISMLTGLLGSTEGSANVFGTSIENMSAIRQSMGVCPQHDILFPDLTVKEHLELFASFKGVPRNLVDKKVADKIAEVGLTEKVNVRSKNLSGGMKRKLSVAIALIGDSKFVVLDEPTSGMDPFSRRSTWNILKNNKAGRVIILTTHFMDEADILGDRIGIMGEGRLICCGSPLFLKQRFGIGYCLSIVRKDGSDTSKIHAAVKQFVPSMQVLTDVGAETVLQLPFSDVDAFPDLFTSIESRKDELGILSYGISATTLEEVFLRIARGDEETDRMRRQGSKAILPDLDSKPRQFDAEQFDHHSVNRFDLFWRHLISLMLKRFRYAKRDWKFILFEVFIPIIVMTIGLVLVKFLTFDDKSSKLFSTSPYNADLKLTNYLPYNTMPGSNVTDILARIPASTASPYSVALSSFDGSAVNTTVVGAGLKEMSLYLLRSISDFRATRYGGTFFVTAAPSSVSYVVMHNSTALHSVPVFLNIANDAVLKWVTGDNNWGIKTTVAPWPLTAVERANYRSVSGFSGALIIMIAFCFIPASLIAYIVREREINVKHQHLVSGVSILAYWLANFIFDIIKYTVPFVLAILVILAFQIDDIMNDSGYNAIVALFWLFGPSAIAFTYVFSFLFQSYSNAQNGSILINFLTGLILMILAFVLRLIPSSRDINQDLLNLYRIFPLFCFADGISSVTQRTLYGQTFNRVSNPYKAFDWDISGGSICFMAAESVIYFIIVLIIEYIQMLPAARKGIFPLSGAERTLLANSLANMQEDEDVVTERHRVGNMKVDDCVVRVNGLKKLYRTSPPKLAIRKLDFAIDYGECFALLGINGAGKTSAFKILTGETGPSEGEASIAGKDVVTNLPEARYKIGYCPQFDALLDLLTAREHLELYANIKGIPKDKVKAVVEQSLRDMDLEQYADRPAGGYSGGNKRKLSVAIAMVGGPPIVFLDEPSTGMDPVSRRFMWDVIAAITARKKSSVILTTHSMEEAEALSTRIAIMVGGRIRCLGPAQHLKSKFGQGYELDLKSCLPTEAQVEEVLQRVKHLTNQDEAFAKDKLEEVCRLLGDQTRQNQIQEHGSGAFIHASLSRDSQVSSKSFAEWWITEDRLHAIAAFVYSQFPGSVLLEHHSSFSRFRLPKQNLSLADVFRVFAENKEKLFVQEYSLSQTTLEQIFNSFAAQQEEEQGQVAGMYAS